MSTSTVCQTCMRAFVRSGARKSRYMKPPSLPRQQAHNAHSSPALMRTLTTAAVPASRRYASSGAAGAAEEEIGDGASASAAQSEARVRRQGEASYTEHSIAIEATEALFKECARQADYIVPEAFEGDAEIPKTAQGEDMGKGTGWWYDEVGLTPTFNTWAQVTFLHMYLLTVRLRYFSESYTNIWQQHLTDHFFWEAEHRMTIFHKQSSKSIRQSYLKELYNQWRGVIGAYDEGLIRGDAVLATAVWRNIFKADENADWTKIALIVSYMRRALKGLDATADKRIVDSMVRFGTPASEGSIVELVSKAYKVPLGEKEADLLQQFEKTGKIPLQEEA